MSSRRLSLVLTALISAVPLALAACGGDDDEPAAPATATDRDRQRGGPVESATPRLNVGGNPRQARPGQARAALGDYWTPQRMQNARPVEPEAPRETPGARGRERAEPEGGRPVEEPGKAAAVRKSAPLTATRAGRGRASATAVPWEGSTEVMPAMAVGKVFFSKRSGGDYVCSGTLVQARLVWTAGHCLSEGGQFHDNWVFAPGYRDGATPFGVWPAQRTLALTAWLKRENLRFDVGAAVLVRASDGSSVGDTTGWHGTRFNQNAGRFFVAFGYPAGQPFDGSDLYLCAGRPFGRGFPGARNSGPATIALRCDMTGGSSGGGWLVDYQPARGWGFVESVNSYGPADVMFGPYHGAAARSLWQAAFNFQQSG